MATNNPNKATTAKPGEQPSLTQPQLLTPQPTQQTVVQIPPPAPPLEHYAVPEIPISTAPIIGQLSLSQDPHPLDGNELLAIIAFELAKKFIDSAVNSTQFSSIVAFNHHTIKFGSTWGLAVHDHWDTSALDQKSGQFQFELDLTKINIDWYRVQAGLGLYHEETMGGGRIGRELRAAPTALVLAHLLKLGGRIGEVAADGTTGPGIGRMYDGRP